MKKTISLLLALCMLLSVIPALGVNTLAVDKSPENETAILDIIVVNGGYANAGTVTGEGVYPVGTTVTVTAKPNMGFGFWSWSGEGDNVLTEEMSYTFTIYEDTVLIADFFKAPFEDICGTDYYFDPVLWAVKEGITTGTSTTEFSPEEDCTRAQVVTFLHRSVGCPMPMPESPFSDVTGGEYYYDAVLWAAGSKITTGRTATTFTPDEACTRAQVVTFLWRTCGEPAPISNNNPFTDVSASEYYYDAVLWAVEQGITTGTSATTFSPEETCIRGQIVTFLYRYMTGGESDLMVISQPKNHLMQSSQETVEFRVEVKGGTGPYTYRWTVLRDEVPTEALQETSESTSHVFSLDVSDYDFDECHYFLVNCDIEDAKGARVQSEYACVYPYFDIKSSPQDYQMRSSGETAGFTVEVAGDTGPYTYQWVVSYDGEKVMPTPVTSAFPSNTLAYYFSDYDFETYEIIRVYCIITNSYGVKITSGYALVSPKE